MNYVTASLVLLVASLAANAQQRRAPTVQERIRNMKGTAVQIGYTSDAPRPDLPLPDFPHRSGTGFLVSQQGYALTAGHVIRGAEAEAKAKGASKVVIKVGLLLDPSSNSDMRFRGSF